MPCNCYYTPPEASERFIKRLCELIVNEIRFLKLQGDPVGISIKSTKELLDHLYKPETCKENPKNE